MNTQASPGLLFATATAPCTFGGPHIKKKHGLERPRQLIEKLNP